jgi:hypothetical protein
MDLCGDAAVQSAALFEAYWLESGRDGLDADGTGDGGWSRALMVICSVATVAAAVVLAVADQLA